jgi:hypothetical protein
MAKYITTLERGHIRNASVTYFGLALLLMGSIGNELKLTMPSVGFNLHIYPLPFALPSIDLGSWPVLIIDLVFLGFSLFLMASLFIKFLFRRAVRISRYFNIIVIILLPMTFFIGAAKGLILLANVPPPWFAIFTWATIILLCAFEVHSIIEAAHSKAPNYQKANK